MADLVGDVPSPAPRLHIVRGACRALYAFDIGYAIDLDEVERRSVDLAAIGFGRTTLSVARRSPRHFAFRSPPLRMECAVEARQVGQFASAPQLEIQLFDFGAVSVTCRFAVDGPIEQLVDLSERLYENTALVQFTRGQVEALVQSLGPAVVRPELPLMVEDYVIYEILEQRIERGMGQAEVGLAGWVQANRPLLAGLLRAERCSLSEQEVADALACRIDYTTSSAALVDWNAALVFDPEPADIVAALEYANVELLEMRHLDDRLDVALGRASLGVDRTVLARNRPSRRQLKADLRWVAAMQTESALLFEGVNNALKLLGDQYLARLYRMACQRFHLPDWDASILRKLATLDNIHRTLSDQHTTRRMEVLEWIIIALIAFEVLMSVQQRWFG